MRHLVFFRGYFPIACLQSVHTMKKRSFCKFDLLLELPVTAFPNLKLPRETMKTGS